MFEQTLCIMMMNWLLIVISVYAGRALQVAKTTEVESLRSFKRRKAFWYLFLAVILALISSTGFSLNNYQRGQVDALKGKLMFKYNTKELRYLRCPPYNKDTIITNKNLIEKNDFQK